jgi:hypothetical protein
LEIRKVFSNSRAHNGAGRQLSAIGKSPSKSER